MKNKNRRGRGEIAAVEDSLAMTALRGRGGIWFQFIFSDYIHSNFTHIKTPSCLMAHGSCLFLQIQKVYLMKFFLHKSLCQ